MAFNLEDQAPIGDVPPASVSLDKERAVVALVNRAARLSDERKYLEWMDLFADDAVYSAITYENANSSGLYLFKDTGRRALHMRAAFLMGLWQTPRGKTLHLVSNTQVESDGAADTVTATSQFIMMRTAEMEPSKFHACGTYYDCCTRGSKGWVFKERRVVVDTNVLPPEFTELL